MNRGYFIVEIPITTFLENFAIRQKWNLDTLTFWVIRNTGNIYYSLESSVIAKYSDFL